MEDNTLTDNWKDDTPTDNWVHEWTTGWMIISPQKHEIKKNQITKQKDKSEHL